MVDTIRERTGKIDIFVSNAGVPADGMGYCKFLDSSPQDWQKFANFLSLTRNANLTKINLGFRATIKD